MIVNNVYILPHGRGTISYGRKHIELIEQYQQGMDVDIDSQNLTIGTLVDGNTYVNITNIEPNVVLDGVMLESSAYYMDGNTIVIAT